MSSKSSGMIGSPGPPSPNQVNNALNEVPPSPLSGESQKGSSAENSSVVAQQGLDVDMNDAVVANGLDAGAEAPVVAQQLDAANSELVITHEGPDAHSDTSALVPFNKEEDSDRQAKTVVRRKRNKNVEVAPCPLHELPDGQTALFLFGEDDSSKGFPVIIESAEQFTHLWNLTHPEGQQVDLSNIRAAPEGYKSVMTYWWQTLKRGEFDFKNPDLKVSIHNQMGDKRSWDEIMIDDLEVEFTATDLSSNVPRKFARIMVPLSDKNLIQQVLEVNCRRYRLPFSFTDEYFKLIDNGKSKPEVSQKQLTTGMEVDRDGTSNDASDRAKVVEEWKKMGKPVCAQCGKKHPPPCNLCPNCGKHHPPPCNPEIVARSVAHASAKKDKAPVPGVDSSKHNPRKRKAADGDEHQDAGEKDSTKSTKDKQSGSQPAAKKQAISQKPEDAAKTSQPATVSTKSKLCRGCGNFHKDECKTPVCSACRNRHSKAVSCDTGLRILQDKLKKHGVVPKAMSLPVPQMNPWAGQTASSPAVPSAPVSMPQPQAPAPVQVPTQAQAFAQQPMPMPVFGQQQFGPAQTFAPFQYNGFERLAAMQLREYALMNNMSASQPVYSTAPPAANIQPAAAQPQQDGPPRHTRRGRTPSSVRNQKKSNPDAGN